MKHLRNQTKWVRSILVLILACGSIISCGGGGSDLVSSGGGVGGTGISGGGTGGTGISAGSVTAIGSVHVNGVRFDTTEAEIFIEGQSQGLGDPAVLANLAVGMIVRVEGDIESDTSGTAHRVYFSDDLRGPVESIVKIDSIPVTITILGKEIVLKASTQTRGLNLNSLAVDDWVQISGLEDSEGRLRASFVTTSDHSAKAILKGIVSSLNTTQREFQINGITIDYHSAEFIGITQFSENIRVRVTGALSADYSRIAAEMVERVDILGATDAENVELEGIILEKVSDTQLSLDGSTIYLDAQTEYIDGDISNLDSGVWVEIEGELIAGVLYAAKVIFKNDLKIEAPVKINDVPESTIVLAGLPGITVRYSDPVTKVTGDVGMAATITTDHYVKVLGRETIPGTLAAIHIIVKDRFDDTVKLQGTLQNYSAPYATVIDHDIDLNAIPDDGFESPEGVSVTRGEFVDAITTGRADFISVRGELTVNESIVWQSISAE